MSGNEAGKDALEILSTAKIIYEIYERVNEEDNKLAALRVCWITSFSLISLNPFLLAFLSTAISVIFF